MKYNLQTPSPFRLPRRQPPAPRSAGPQFANSPRFLLSQLTPQRGATDLDIIDDDVRPSIAGVVRTPAHSRTALQPRRPRDVIDDFDNKPSTQFGSQNKHTSHISDDDIDSSPPENSETPGVLDPEFDVLFAPTRDGSKRQRLSAGLRQSLEQKLASEPESPDTRRILSATLETPAPCRIARSAVTQDLSVQATPGNSMKPDGPGVSTPGSIKTPFRSRPKFVLSSNKPPGSQKPFRGEMPTASQPASPPERRKLAFVLPRSPSPITADEDIPAPFSPSSRTLHRRGRHRSGTLGYAAGGMAAGVRSWVLETGSKREQRPIRTSVETKADIDQHLDRYLVAARARHVKQAMFVSSGPLAFVQAEQISSLSGTAEESQPLNLLLMGPPRTTTSSHLPSATRTGIIQEGALVGIYRGLAWDLEIQEFQSFINNKGLSPSLSETVDPDDRNRRWLVAMEWDLIDGIDGGPG
ncbi:hypothetical protein N7462_001841 [Penicillium macrosclerotiorum]|uniref:uncharacterized protein n=1 Tax=Penicillium macrosclerotiorum TaxID=303699 RepID=UPI00254939BB|nr:uncharacterized protein N7462_001841 [Penicillium macrosclerotiorum]KAJ5692418.1 hypothetical protein N7462_001841 [Penicillium macrosclerotiorum]